MQQLLYGRGICCWEGSAKIFTNLRASTRPHWRAKQQSLSELDSLTASQAWMSITSPLPFAPPTGGSFAFCSGIVSRSTFGDFCGAWGAIIALMDATDPTLETITTFSTDLNYTREVPTPHWASRKTVQKTGEEMANGTGKF